MAAGAAVVGVSISLDPSDDSKEAVVVPSSVVSAAGGNAVVGAPSSSSDESPADSANIRDCFALHARRTLLFTPLLEVATPEGTKDRTEKVEQSDRGHTTRRSHRLLSTLSILYRNRHKRRLI